MLTGKLHELMAAILASQAGQSASGSTVPPQTADGAAGQSGAAAGAMGGGWEFFAIIGVMFLVFWLLIMRPASKQRKQLKAKVESIAKGDRILTGAGFHMSVTGIREHSVMAQMGEGEHKIKVEIGKSFIQNVYKDVGEDWDEDEESDDKTSGEKSKD